MSVDDTPPPPVPEVSVVAPEGPGFPSAEPGVVPDHPPSAEPTAEAPPTPSAGPQRVPRTRASTAYVGVGGGLVVLVLILIFIIQNLDTASLHYLGLQFTLPIGLLMLIALVLGGLIVLFVSLARVTQLRLRARRSPPDRKP